MATPNQSTGVIPSNLTPTQILHLIATNPELLTESEQQLSQDQKIALIHNKIVKLVQQQKAKQAAQGQQQQQGGNGNGNGNGNGQGNGQGQGQGGTMSSPAPGQGQTPGPGQTPQGQAKRGPGRPPGQQQVPNRNVGPAQGQGQGQGQGQVQGNQPMMQDQMRMQQQQQHQQQQQQQQQQHPQQQQQLPPQQNQNQNQNQQTQPTPQQQQHFQLALEKTQRLQQQNLQQQAQQQMQQQMAAMQQQHQGQGQMPTPSQQQAQLPHPPPPMNMTAPSPQQQQPGQSPMVMHSSPNPGPGPGLMRNNSMNGMPAPPPPPGPGPVPQNKAFPQMQTIIDNFPNLYKRKHAGQLQPEQENLFDQFLSTDAGQSALQRFRSQEASIVIQNNLANPVSQPHQMPPMTQAQLQMAAQQQLAPLQQQQQQQQAQQAAAAAAHVQAAQLAAQQQQFQNLVQGGQHQRMDPTQFQQMQLRQLAQANMSRAQGAVANMAQANAMARAQAAMHAQQQQQQMGDVGMQQGQMNFGSPRPPQMQQGQVGPAMQQSKNMRQTIAKLSAMPEAQREQIFNTKPEIRQVYYANVGAMGLGNPGQSPQVNGAGTPNAMQARAPALNSFMPNNVPVNLHIPAGKQRNNSSGGANQAGQSPMRPPNQLILPQGAPNSNSNQNAQIATIQRMISQGIPVQGANGQFVRPPVNPALYAAQQGMQGQGQRQTPEQFMNHQQQNGQDGNRSIAPQVLRTSSTGTPVGQNHMQSDVISHGLLNRTNWQPTLESDAALADKLAEFRPSIRSSGRGTRVLNDVVMEIMPESLRAIADEVDQGGDSKKGLENVSGLPGQKKRKVQELADGIDRGLVIDEDIEKLVLNIADEHLDVIGQFACGLAKHRKSEVVDRKDIQVAYEMLYGRIYPAFSSDSIRLDQAKSGRRTQPATTSVRASRMKAVNDHKALIKKERKAAAVAVKLEKEEVVENEDQKVNPVVPVVA